MSNWGTTPKLPELLDAGARPLSYRDAISEAMRTALQADPRVRVFGEGVTDKGGTYGTTLGLHLQFGDERVFDVPTAEGIINGLGVGMSLGGLRPVVIHPRNDFLLMGIDQICNHAAKWGLMFGHRKPTPMAIRSVACRGWGSAAQHSQALHAICAHFPGLEVAVPFQPADAKAMLLYAALEADGPVMVLEHKWLWNLTAHVPEGLTAVGPGPAQVVRHGADATIAALSYGVAEALLAADTLHREHGVSCEVVDLRWLRPLDAGPVAGSVARTGHLVVVDTGHVEYGVAGEVIARVLELAGPGVLRSAPKRLGMPASPVPACSESTYYPGPGDIVSAVLRLTGCTAPSCSADCACDAPSQPARPELRPRT